MGIPYEMYRPMVAIDVAAPKATELPSEGRDRQKARKAASQTVRMGERNLSSTLWKNFGWSNSQISLQVRNWGGPYNSSITGKGKHHSGIRGHREESTVPDTDHHKGHQNHGSVVSTCIGKNLEYWLPEVSTSRREREVLDGEQKTHDDEETEQGGEPNGRDDANWGRP